MKYLGSITDNKDMVTKEYVDQRVPSGTTAVYQKHESTYTTSSGSTSTIPINVSGYQSTDILLVDVNGLDLVLGTDYTISGNNIVLTTPITSAGAVVHFTALRAGLIPTQDLNQLKGDPGVVQDVEVDGVSVLNGAVAEIDLSDYVKEDANGDISVTRNITAGGDVNADISELSGVYSGGLNDKALMTDDTVLDWQTILNTQTTDRGLIDQILAKLADDHKYDCDWTAIPLSSSTNQYGGQTPKYKRYGKVVQVVGAVSPKSQVAAGGSLFIGTLPANYRPTHMYLNALCQASGNDKWLLEINYDGTMYARRHSTGGTNKAIATSTWLVFTHTFLV